MSTIDDLVERWCPDGVPYSRLGEVCTFTKGQKPRRDQQEAGPFPLVTAAKDAQAHIAHFNWEGPALTMASHGVPGFANFWDSNIWLSNNVFLLTEDADVLSKKFLFYVLKSLSSEISTHVHTGGIPYFNSRDVALVRVPLPPLEIQAEIVRILDCFTSLEVELEVELEARKEQFEYFRHRALQFSGTVPVFRLCDIASISTGTRPVNMHSHEAGSVPYFNGGVEPSGWVDDANCRSDAITIPSRGSVGIVRYQRDPFWCGPLCYQIRSVSPSLRTKFLFFWLKEIQTSIVALQQTGSIPALNKKQLATVMVPVPALETQDKVIHALNELETLISSPEVGIQAEIESRRQQYEYYRDRLLAFEEKVS